MNEIGAFYDKNAQYEWERLEQTWQELRNRSILT